MIRIDCERCGATVLIEGVSYPERYSEVTLSVTPCEDCLEEARKEGRKEEREDPANQNDSGIPNLGDKWPEYGKLDLGPTL